MVLKSGSRVHWNEYEALKLAQELRIPSPTVYEALVLQDGEVSIRMDLVEGDRLEDAWPKMSAEEKTAVAQQLRGIITSMTSVPCTSGLIGSCDGKIVRDCRRYCEYTGGPFENEADFNHFALDLYPSTPTQLRNALAERMRSNHRIVFTHGDLTQSNIIVKDNKIVGLVDWEYSGWYPEYWEYIKFFERHAKNKDWKEYVKDIFPQLYDEELVLFQAITRWQKP